MSYILLWPKISLCYVYSGITTALQAALLWQLRAVHPQDVELKGFQELTACLPAMMRGGHAYFPDADKGISPPTIGCCRHRSILDCELLEAPVLPARPLLCLASDRLSLRSCRFLRCLAMKPPGPGCMINSALSSMK